MDQGDEDKEVQTKAADADPTAGIGPNATSEQISTGDDENKNTSKDNALTSSNGLGSKRTREESKTNATKGNALTSSGALGSKRDRDETNGLSTTNKSYGDNISGSKRRKKVCFAFQRGECNRGDLCRFAHELRQDYDESSHNHKKRRRTDYDPTSLKKLPRKPMVTSASNRIKLLLIKIGDGTPDKCPTAHFQGLTLALAKDVNKFADIIIETCVECAASFPTKTSIYGTLIGLLNANLQNKKQSNDEAATETERDMEAENKNTVELSSSSDVDVVQRIMEKVVDEMHKCAVKLFVRNTNTRFSLLLRFLFELTNAGTIASEGLFDFLFELLNKYTLLTIMQNIPYLHKSILCSDEERTEKLANSLHELVGLELLGSEYVFKPSSELEKANSSCVHTAWKICESLLRTKISVNDEGENGPVIVFQPYRDETLKEELLKQIPLLSLSNLNGSNRLIELFNDQGTELGSRHEPYKQTVFSVFVPAAAVFKEKIRAKNPDMPKSGLELAAEAIEAFSDVDAFLIRQHVIDIVNGFHPLTKDVCSMFEWINTPLPLAHIIVETILGLMLTFPIPEHEILYYESLLVRLCKNNPDVYGVVVEDSIDSYLVCIRQADIEASMRMSRYFAFHLSTFGLKWPWGKWDGIASNPKIEDSDERKKFLKMVLERLLNLSYLEGVENELTNATKKLLPPPHKPVSPYFDSDGDHNGDLEGTKAQSMLTYIKTKPSSDDLLSWFKEKYFSGNRLEDNALDVVLNVALQAGVPSYTHTSKAFERMRVLLRFIKEEGADDEKQVDRAIIEAVAKFWNSSPSWVAYISKELLAMGTVSHAAVLDYFVETMGNVHAKHATKFEWVGFDFLSEWLVQLEADRETTTGRKVVDETTEFHTGSEENKSDGAPELKPEKQVDSNINTDKEKNVDINIRKVDGDEVVKYFYESLKRSSEYSENPLYASSLLRKHSGLFQI